MVPSAESSSCSLQEQKRVHKVYFTGAEHLTNKDRARADNSGDQGIECFRSMFSEEKANDFWRRKKGELSKKSYYTYLKCFSYSKLMAELLLLLQQAQCT